MLEQRFNMEGGGTLTLCQDGPRVHLMAERNWDQRGLYKVWLRGSSGGRMLLGTLSPEGGKLCLRRSVSIGELERAHCWPVERVEAPLAFSFQNRERWHRETDPGRRLADPVLRGQVKGPMLYQGMQDGFRLAVPFRTECPFPLESLFCLARVERLDGKAHMIWTFNQDGTPKIPHNEDVSGQTTSNNGACPR